MVGYPQLAKDVNLGGDIPAAHLIPGPGPAVARGAGASLTVDEATAGRSHGGSPRRVTLTLLVLFLVGTCSRGYGFYAQMMRSGGAEWDGVLQGTATAPEQYRIGVVYTAAWMGRLLHLKLSQAFGILDLAGALLCVLLLYRLLERKEIYRTAPRMLQWFGSVSFLALTIYYIDWTGWYQKVATLPTAGGVALMLWLWTRDGERGSVARQTGIAALFFLLALAQAFVRADVMLLICAGIFVSSLLGWSPDLAMSRPMSLLVSAVTAVAVLGVQVYLMKVRYPHATYAGVPVFMLKHDFKRPTEWATWYIFLAPFLWTAVRMFRRKFRVEGAGAAFLLGGLGYILVWIVLGRLDEVRIFIPMAMASVPLTVELAMGWVKFLSAGDVGLTSGTEAS